MVPSCFIYRDLVPFLMRLIAIGLILSKVALVILVHGLQSLLSIILEEVGDSDSGSCHLSAVSWSNPFLCCPNLF